MIDLLLIGCALLISLAGLAWLWRGWKDGAAMGPRVAVACALWAGATTIWIDRFGAEIGIPLALETAALIAFAFILSRMERRTGRPPRERSASLPPRSGRHILVGCLRALVAGPVGLVAALGIAIVIATRAPLAEQTRLILGGLIVPTLWAIGIAWIACQRRLPLQTATFAAIGVAGFGISFLGGA
jgi:hypothetical protein